MSQTNIAIFASGSGSNTEILVNYFHFNPQINVSCIITNNPNAHVLERAKRLKVKAYVIKPSEMTPSGKILSIFVEEDINFIVLAGYMKLIPEWIVNRFKNKIINIHPALLPKYGGKGMYGNRIHEAVIAADEKESGITIHIIDKDYDKGKILFQATCPVSPDDTPEILATKIHRLEHRHYPIEIEKYIGQL
ncbi:MAG TPA: phosphoribosylglycinamide formyltransferase [Salinivirgaceae bacterium]|nr:phosphoribosylglycinamide formyltransferase [Salinivirgaceae bacterium]HQA76551.1 phosphoribosylglycinamide formyltransferase [Salinivirgaceae bacterium]